MIAFRRVESSAAMARLGTTAAVVSIALVFAACTHRYTPTEYAIDTERIAPFPTGAPVRVATDGPSTEKQVVFENMGHHFVTTYAEVTDVLVAQLAKEIRKRGGTVSPDATKTVRVTVIGMSGHANFATLDGYVRTRLQVGDAPPREIFVQNTSPATVYRALDGAIARTVMEILADRDVLAYLASTQPPAVVDAGQ
jgi:hypothetical protein